MPVSVRAVSLFRAVCPVCCGVTFTLCCVCVRCYLLVDLSTCTQTHSARWYIGCEESGVVIVVKQCVDASSPSERCFAITVESERKYDYNRFRKFIVLFD